MVCIQFTVNRVQGFIFSAIYCASIEMRNPLHEVSDWLDLTIVASIEK